MGVISFGIAALVGYLLSPQIAILLFVWMIAYHVATSEGLHANRIARLFTRDRLRPPDPCASTRILASSSLTTMKIEPKGRTMQNSETQDTRALVQRLFATYERGDSQQLFDHVAEDVHWTITGNHPLSGEYRSKREFLDATYERLDAVLKEPVRPRVRRIITEGDLAVVEWHGHATSIVDRPYDNDYCWVIRVAGDRIVEVTAYLDGALVEELFRTTER